MVFWHIKTNNYVRQEIGSFVSKLKPKSTTSDFPSKIVALEGFDLNHATFKELTEKMHVVVTNNGELVFSEALAKILDDT